LDFGAYIRIIRPSGCILIALTTLIGQVLALGSFPEPFLAINAILSSFLLTASSFTLNDYVDYEVDLINTPHRPIPSGRISRQEAFRYGIVLGIAGAAFTVLLNYTAAAIGFALYALTIFYTIKAKIYGFIGNIIVALSIASYFLFGYLSVKTQMDLNIVYITGICFFYVLGGEVAQSIADAEGDRLRGVKSISLMRGPRVAAVITSLCYIMMATLGAYSAQHLGYRTKYSSFLIIGTILAVGLITVPLLRRPDKESSMRTRNMINAIAFLIIIGFLIILFA
jgi:geranylgeranylglycerol-phosphate geranylgeranyltransferase